MIAPLTVPCKPCSGSGLVPREKRRLENGEIDPFDFIDWQMITCEPCGGAGALPLNYAEVEEG